MSPTLKMIDGGLTQLTQPKASIIVTPLGISGQRIVMIDLDDPLLFDVTPAVQEHFTKLLQHNHNGASVAEQLLCLFKVAREMKW